MARSRFRYTLKRDGGTVASSADIVDLLSSVSVNDLADGHEWHIVDNNPGVRWKRWRVWCTVGAGVTLEAEDGDG